MQSKAIQIDAQQKVIGGNARDQELVDYLLPSIIRKFGHSPSKIVVYGENGKFAKIEVEFAPGWIV